jgi:hypothetical protein
MVGWEGLNMQLCHLSPLLLMSHILMTRLTSRESTAAYMMSIQPLKVA